MEASSLVVLLTTIKQELHQLRREERGQDLIEYALLLGFVTIAATAFFPTDIAPSISSIFERVVNFLNSSPGGGGS
jgi:Flp pilus assembly pilin Flp